MEVEITTVDDTDHRYLDIETGEIRIGEDRLKEWKRALKEWKRALKEWKRALNDQSEMETLDKKHP